MWVYVLGEVTGADVKIGHTGDSAVLRRLRAVNNEANNDRYVLLAAVNSQRSGEDHAKRYFDKLGLRKQKGSRTEYFEPAPEVVEWILWLRQQWFVSFDPGDELSDFPDTHFSAWTPAPDRRVARPAADPAKLVQDYEQLEGALANTAWAWMPDMLASFQDYFTPIELVERAAMAMGGIDGDAASHWIAYKRMREAGIAIPEYLHINRSAFENPWFERTWLNPPYGDNDRWFTRALEMMDAGVMTQLCMLSPVYVFTTRIAEEIMRRSAAAVLLSPTPKFWNPGDPSKDGTNHPHAIVYWGERRDHFISAYRDKGIPITVAWEDIEPLRVAA